MRKFENWQHLLVEFVVKNREKKFSWGTWDCCLMVADCVKDMTGEDFAADFRGKYDDGPGAFKALADFTGGSGEIGDTMDLLAPRFDWIAIDNPLMIQRSDIALVSPGAYGADPRFGGGLAICAGTLSVYLVPDGLMTFSTIPYPGTPGIARGWRIKPGRD